MRENAAECKNTETPLFTISSYSFECVILSFKQGINSFKSKQSPKEK